MYEYLVNGQKHRATHLSFDWSVFNQSYNTGNKIENLKKVKHTNNTHSATYVTNLWEIIAIYIIYSRILNESFFNATAIFLLTWHIETRLDNVDKCTVFTSR